MFEIEKGIPLSPIVRRGRPRIYPFGDMQPGDSLFIPLGTHPTLISLGRMLYVAARRVTDVNWTFKIRRDIENNGVRIWRIS